MIPIHATSGSRGAVSVLSELDFSISGMDSELSLLRKYKTKGLGRMKCLLCKMEDLSSEAALETSKCGGVPGLQACVDSWGPLLSQPRLGGKSRPVKDPVSKIKIQ